MKKPDSEEQSRLAHLESFHILDTPAEAVFDRLTQLAAHVCQTPMAVMTLIDEHRQWFKSAVGLNVRETERSIAFCDHAMEARSLFVVPDARQDSRFADNPLVVGEPNISFYAGVPLVSPDGVPLGSFAVLDRKPRRLSELQLTALEMLAQHVMAQVELRRQRIDLEALGHERDRLWLDLQRQSEHLRQAQRIAAVGSWECELGELRYSEEIRRILGVPPQRSLDSLDDYAQSVLEADRPRWYECQRALREQKTPIQLEYRIRRPDGSVRHVLEKAEWTDGGSPIMAGTVQDVTDQHQANEQLKLLESSIARISDVVMVTDAAQIDEPGPRIVFVNDAFERATGYRRADVLGRSPRLLQGEKTQKGELDRIRGALRRQQPVSAELINYKKGGEQYWSELDISPIRDGEGRVTHFVSVQRDISERKQRSIELAYAIRAMQMLTQCNSALVRLENEQELLEEICRIGVDTGGYRLSWVGYALNDEGRTVLPMAYAGAHAEAQVHDLAEAGISWDENRANGRGPGGNAIRSGEPRVIQDVMKEAAFSPWSAIARRHGFRGVICLPLRERERVFGILALHTSEVRAVANQEIALLQELADNLAFGIGHIRSLQKRRRIESAVLKVAASVSASSGKAFFEQLVRNMVDATGAAAGFLCRFADFEHMQADVALVDGERRADVEHIEYPAGETPCSLALEERSWIIQDGLAQRYPLITRLLGCPAQACAGQRLETSSGQLLGTLFVLYRDPLEEASLVESTLKIFAARASAELERQDADARIKEQASLLDKAQDAIIVASIDGGITYWNKGAERLYGYLAEEVRGRARPELIAQDRGQFEQATQTALKAGEWAGEIRTRRKDGSELVVDSHWSLVRDGEGQPKAIFAIDTDITRRKRDEKEIEHLAFFDPLTRLPNRRLLLDRLRHALSTAARLDVAGALLFIDLDNFKSLNDTLGHHTGDLLLQQVARRLEACVPRKSDTVARFGGDEFVVLLEELSAAPSEAAAHAEHVAEKILAAFRQPFQLEIHEHHSSPSIGVALFDREHSDLDDILKRADLAMYQSKGAGRNTVRFFDPEMQTVVSARVALEADFRKSLKRREFSLYYQAQTDQHGRTTGMEALVRWLHPRRGMVMPAQFIPFAEESGLILRLGQWVLEAACAQLAAWAANPATAHLTVAVNVSARQFRHPDFVRQVLDVIKRTGAPAHQLKLELTESLLLSNIEDTIGKMSTLKEAGVGFSLDDFGTGYSSLSYLKRLPLDQLKIDQSFVRDVLIDSNDAVIAKTIVALGQNLGLAVIAEGVETTGQRDFLAQSGCLAYQGFLFGQPMPAEQIV